MKTIISIEIGARFTLRWMGMGRNDDIRSRIDSVQKSIIVICDLNPI